jgi:hypothetical protein
VRDKLAPLAVAIGVLAAAGGARADDDVHAQFHSTMDSVFGAGGWRITGGYRTQARENELRAQGALTVAPGRISRHSHGTRARPGAYDVVVDGVSPFSAAAKLRKANAPFRTIFPEGRHGSQGAHLHIDPYAGGRSVASHEPPGIPWRVANPTPAQLALAALYERAKQGDAAAQLEFGVLHAQGAKGASQNLVAAYVWTALAAANPASSLEMRTQAEHGLTTLATRMTADEMFDAKLFLPAPGADDAGQAVGFVVARPREAQGVRVAQVEGKLMPVSTAQPACAALAKASCGVGAQTPVR